LTPVKFTAYAVIAQRLIREKLFANPLDCFRNSLALSGICNEKNASHKLEKTASPTEEDEGRGKRRTTNNLRLFPVYRAFPLPEPCFSPYSNHANTDYRD
jgi:hypothetical protein